ncbi:MAG: N-acetylmuramic acid 6-phosphate etherase [Bacteroidota bacterium]|nr:N-acetylmuramic acid 6-phosphate etherase [Bacteroidota bacterium]MDP4211690.1 N-acetylmuramic acid 6-phosphate etherase [Bacteroidota bacterium]MDP4250473.1 N-acetylmuramic acid 6-phosphate etherase [Bacteroidota bacterium]
MGFEKITEEQGQYRHLEKMSIHELLTLMNKEDQQVPDAVGRSIPQIEKLAERVTDRMLAGGRLFYLGAGTSGRLGILDASEIPPTFGMPYGLIIGLIAGGEEAIRTPVENAEDDPNQGWLDLKEYEICEKDLVIGIAASGTTPYVIGALETCRKNNITTGCVTCNRGTPLAAVSDYPVEVVVGPEFVTGSTRMKSGTAQKLVLNMISTSVMIRIGRVEDTRMVNMQLTNSKLIDRGTRMLMNQSGIKDYEKAKSLLMKFGSVKKAAENRKG